MQIFETPSMLLAYSTSASKFLGFGDAGTFSLRCHVSDHDAESYPPPPALQGDAG